MPKYGDYTSITLVDGTELLVAKKGNQTQSLSINQIKDFVESELDISDQQSGDIININGSTTRKEGWFSFTGNGASSDGLLSGSFMTVPDAQYIIPRSFKFIHAGLDRDVFDLDIDVGVWNPVGGIIYPLAEIDRLYFGEDGNAVNDGDQIPFGFPASVSQTVIYFDAGIESYSENKNKKKMSIIAPGQEIRFELSLPDTFLEINEEWKFGLIMEYEIISFPAEAEFVDLGQM